MKEIINRYTIALLSVIMVCLLAMPASASGNPGAGCAALAVCIDSALPRTIKQGGK